MPDPEIRPRLYRVIGANLPKPFKNELQNRGAGQTVPLKVVFGGGKRVEAFWPAARGRAGSPCGAPVQSWASGTDRTSACDPPSNIATDETLSFGTD